MIQSDLNEPNSKNRFFPSGPIVDTSIERIVPTVDAPTDEAALIAEPALAPKRIIVEPPPIEEEMASVMAIIDAIAVDDSDHFIDFHVSFSFDVLL